MVPFLRGKPVHPRTAIIPATVVAILVTDAGMAYLRAMLTGQVSLDWGSGPALLWSVWGVAGRRHSRLPPAPPARRHCHDHEQETTMSAVGGGLLVAVGGAVRHRSS